MVQRYLGLVKWFDSRNGYGFITVLEGSTKEDVGKDIFVHYSGLRTLNSQYKYLVLGEYVEFLLTKTENQKYEYCAQDVTGVKEGNLMCESRRLASLQQQHTTETNEIHHTPSTKRVYKQRALAKH